MSNYKEAFSAKINKELLSEMKLYASNKGISFSAYISTLFEEHVRFKTGNIRPNIKPKCRTEFGNLISTYCDAHRIDDHTLLNPVIYDLIEDESIANPMLSENNRIVFPIQPITRVSYASDIVGLSIDNISANEICVFYDYNGYASLDYLSRMKSISLNIRGFESFTSCLNFAMSNKCIVASGPLMSAYLIRLKNANLLRECVQMDFKYLTTHFVEVEDFVENEIITQVKGLWQCTVEWVESLFKYGSNKEILFFLSSIFPCSKQLNLDDTCLDLYRKNVLKSQVLFRTMKEINAFFGTKDNYKSHVNRFNVPPLSYA